MRGKYIAVIFIAALIFNIAGCGKKEQTTSSGSTQTSTAQEQNVQSQAAPQEMAPQALSRPITEERTLFSFESGNDGFEIPGWAEDKSDNVAKSISISKSYVSNGKQSLCVVADFPGKLWTSATLELEQYLDLSDYRQISVDIYIPEGTPLGLKAKIILTYGDEWSWSEMVRIVPLEPGQWTTVSASLEDGSLEWKRAEVNQAFRSDIRKLDIRIESNKQPVYSGPIYIDNIRVGK